MKRTKKIALTAALSALALAFSYVEFLIPFDLIGVPGIKPGFANLVVMAALYMLGLPYAALISAIRILLSFLLFGNLTSLLYSLAGGALSLAVMFALKKLRAFGEVGVSVAGAAVHNVAQTAVAAALTASGAILWYLPVLLLSAVLFGTVNGLLLKAIIKRTKNLFKTKTGSDG